MSVPVGIDQRDRSAAKASEPTRAHVDGGHRRLRVPARVTPMLGLKKQPNVDRLMSIDRHTFVHVDECIRGRGAAAREQQRAHGRPDPD
jgi:hypothetical protein